MADLQDIIYTTIGDVIEINFDLLFVPLLFLDAQTHTMLIISIKNSFTLSFDSTKRKVFFFEWNIRLILEVPKFLTVLNV